MRDGIAGNWLSGGKCTSADLTGRLCLLGIAGRGQEVVDKNCWIRTFRDDNFHADDSHSRSQRSKEIATVDNLADKDKAWSNESQIVSVGSNAILRANRDENFKRAELAFAPSQQLVNLGKSDMANAIASLKITCGPS